MNWAATSLASAKAASRAASAPWVVRPAWRLSRRPTAVLCLTTRTTSYLSPDRPTAASRVHLLMCTNALYFQHMGVCLTSLLTNNPSLFFDIVVVRRTGEELDEDKLRRTLARFLNYSLSFRVFTFPADPLLPLNPGPLHARQLDAALDRELLPGRHR